MNESVFFDGVRGVFATIDRGVYSLISIFYNTIYKLVDKTIISSSVIDEITSRVYALIAIFMIFKISFSLINYLVNPDLIVDKVKGGGSLVRNIIITLVLVIFVPFGFDLLYEAQNAIINDGLVEKLIHGGTYNERKLEIIMDEDYCVGTPAYTNNIGDYVSLVAFKTFFQIDEQSIQEDSDNFAEIKNMYCEASVINNGMSSVSNLLKNNKVYSAPHGVSLSDYYVVDYLFFLSTIVGVIIALIFLNFCFDIAVRSIKLQFLEILAPVPIISYIDPDKSKNGMFSKWLKEVGTTWLSLFMRLLAYNLALYFISILTASDIEQDNLWMTLLIIIGILMFAKQLPKLLENIMGIKASGSFNLNPFKKLDEEALGFKQARSLAGKTAATAGAVGMSAIGSAYSRNRAKKEFNKNTSKLKDDLRQKIEEERLDGLRKARNNAEYEYANRKYKARMDEFNKGNYSTLNEDVAEKIEKLKEDYDSKFSNRHPLVSSLLAAGRAGNEAFKADHKSIQAIIENASKAATNAAKERTYRDNYGIGDRAMNQITDWGDVKKSGTADIVDRKVKELNDQLTQVTNALDSLRQEQSSFAPGTFMWETSGPNAGMISVSPTANPNDIIRARENVRMQQELQQTMKDLNSAIKSQTKILEQSKK